MLDDSDAKPLEPILMRIDKHGCAPQDIRIDKNEVLMNIKPHVCFTFKTFLT